MGPAQQASDIGLQPHPPSDSDKGDDDRGRHTRLSRLSGLHDFRRGSGPFCFVGDRDPRPMIGSKSRLEWLPCSSQCLISFCRGTCIQSPWAYFLPRSAAAGLGLVSAGRQKVIIVSVAAFGRSNWGYPSRRNAPAAAQLATLIPPSPSPSPPLRPIIWPRLTWWTRDRERLNARSAS